MKQPPLNSPKNFMVTRSRRQHIARNWFFFLLSSSIGLTFADCEQAVGRLESSEGKVVIEQNGQWQPLAIGACVPTDTRIQVSGGRAVFRLANETLLRTSSSTLLRFSAPEEKSWIRLFDGVLHFITRTPHAFDVQTDYVNAGVKGTEFMLAANRTEQFGEVVMFEGEVLASNEHGQQQVHSGEAVIARSGQAPRTTTVPALRGAVQWTLYYPPLPSSSAPRFQPALTYLHRNDTAGALAELEKLPASDHDADYFALVAAANLHRGDIAQAREAIGNALALQPDHTQSLALNSISELTIGNEAEAARLLDRAKNPNDASVLIARSYLQQTQFELASALKSAQQAAAIDPNSALIQARIAELSLMTGDTKQARKFSKNAIALQPDFARAHGIAGFTLMQQLKFDAAETEFKRASELDTTDPLPRLGLGLILIRHNRVSEGREQLAIAVALDPGQSLLRSYLGKAYQEEGRERLANDQYTLAKTFDSADPTPWFYSALLARVQNRPFDALDDLNRSIELNDNRAVYRSRLQLDADEATRTASQAEIYRELGFDTLAQRTAARAVSAAPSEYGGHRQLAESYADDPQYDAARASEVLQAQLLQPLSATPILPLLGETNLLATEGAGPSALGFREYNAMFVREKPWLSVSGLGGSNHTGAGEVTLSGVYDRFSYALSQYHYETQGYRENNDVRYDILSAYTKFQANEKIAFLLSAGQSEEDSGDAADQFLVDDEPDSLSLTQRKKFIQFGTHVSLSSNIDLMAVGNYQKSDLQENSLFFLEDYDLGVNNHRIDKTSSIEIQGLFRGAPSNLIVGAKWAEIKNEEELLVYANAFGETFYDDPSILTDKPRFRSEYAYWTIVPVQTINLLLGSSYAEYDSNKYSNVIKNWAPKFAAQWEMTPSLTLRTAYYQVLKKQTTIEASLEPSHIGGFTQEFDEQAGSESDQYAAGFDFKSTSNFWFGGEAIIRQIRIPLEFSDDPYDADEKLFNIYWNWTIAPWAVSLHYKREEASFSTDAPNSGLNIPVDLVTQKVPLELSWYSAHGLRITVRATYIDQDEKILMIAGGNKTAGDSFFTADTDIELPLLSNRLEIGVGIKNIFDKSFSYQNTNVFDNTPKTLPIVPERTAFAHFKWVIY